MKRDFQCVARGKMQPSVRDLGHFSPELNKLSSPIQGFSTIRTHIYLFQEPSHDFIRLTCHNQSTPSLPGMCDCWGICYDLDQLRWKPHWSNSEDPGEKTERAPEGAISCLQTTEHDLSQNRSAVSGRPEKEGRRSYSSPSLIRDI